MFSNSIPSHRKLAWKRILARVLDQLLFGVFLAMIFSAINGSSEIFLEKFQAHPIRYQYFLTFLLAYLELMFLINGGKTPGKWMVGLHVIPLPPTQTAWPRLLHRVLLMNAIMLTPVFNILIWLLNIVYMMKGQPTLWDAWSLTHVESISTPNTPT